MHEVTNELREPRDVSGTYRMTRSDKARIKHEAAELGLTVQQLFELRMFGHAKPVGRDGRPRLDRHQAEELPIAG